MLADIYKKKRMEMIGLGYMKQGRFAYVLQLGGHDGGVTKQNIAR